MLNKLKVYLCSRTIKLKGLLGAQNLPDMPSISSAAVN